VAYEEHHQHHGHYPDPTYARTDVAPTSSGCREDEVHAPDAHRSGLDDLESCIAEQLDDVVHVDSTMSMEVLDEASPPADLPKSTASTRPPGFSTLRISRAHSSPPRRAAQREQADSSP
jgi:hypothetical protein